MPNVLLEIDRILQWDIRLTFGRPIANPSRCSQCSQGRAVSRIGRWSFGIYGKCEDKIGT